jgi:hypothetical protein
VLSLSRVKRSLKVKVLRSVETSGITGPTTQCHIPEDLQPAMSHIDTYSCVDQKQNCDSYIMSGNKSGMDCIVVSYAAIYRSVN